LEERGIQPAQPATKRTLIRRATLDLLGLPPTPAEIDRFLADDRPDAYARLVDRLLVSPRYGERWGRHWLDVVRYTESDGFEHDKFRPHAWRYRDYVIDSFNADRPYNRFVTEQLAGDVLQPITRGGLVATGFLVAGPWDEVQYVAASQTERKRAHEEQMAELLGTISQTFFAMTVDCARCHDHKFDPFPQVDYYSMKAVFDGVDHSQGRTVSNRSILTAAEKQQHADAIAPINQKIKRLQSQIAAIENQLPQPATLADVNRISPLRFLQNSRSTRRHSPSNVSPSSTARPLSMFSLQTIQKPRPLTGRSIPLQAKAISAPTFPATNRTPSVRASTLPTGTSIIWPCNLTASNSSCSSMPNWSRKQH
jgi:hypothetical protein